MKANHAEVKNNRLRVPVSKAIRRRLGSEFQSFTRIKFCRGCQKYHPIEHFTQVRQSLDGLSARCKGFTRAAARKSYAKNQDLILGKQIENYQMYPAWHKLMRRARYLERKWLPVLESEEQRRLTHQELFPGVVFWSHDLQQAQLHLAEAARLRREAGPMTEDARR